MRRVCPLLGVSVPRVRSLLMPEKKQSSPVVLPDLFSGLPEKVCESILSSAYRREIPSGEVIFRAGDPKKLIYLLTAGRVKITQVSRNGSEVILWLNTPGQIIGSLSLMAGGAHSSTAETIQPCEVLIWDAAVFETNLERYPLFLRNTQHVIARQFSELSCRVREVSTETVLPRLANGIVRLADQIGRQVNGTLELDVTQEALAQMTAMTFYTANRQLSEWEDQGLVLRRKYTIIVRDLPALKRLCNR
jgi:CRP/FNR family transcriptional regulator, nitrogen oxide reductase regulator